MSKLIKLAGDTALYGLGTIVPRALNSLLGLLLHTRVFHPGEYGISVSLYAWVAFLNIIYLFGMETAFFRFATKAGADPTNVFRVTQTFVVSIGLSLTLVIYLFATPIAGYFAIPSHPEFIVWLAMLMFIDALVAIPFARLRLEKKARLFAFAKLINMALVVGLNLYFLLVIYNPEIGIGYIVLANLLGNAFYLVFFAGALTQWRPDWNLTLMRDIFKYAWPVMLMGLAGMTNEVYSRLTLQWWLPENFYPGRDSAYALGVFGACFRYAVIINVGVQAFRFAAEPFFFSESKEKDSPVLFAKVNHYFILVGSFTVLSVVVHLDLLKYLIEKQYWEGLVIVPYLLYGYLFLGVYYNLSVWYKLTDRTYMGTLITVVGMAATLVLNYMLVPVAGYLGSSWATLCCFFVMAATSYFLGQKYYPVPYEAVGALVYIGLSVLLIAISYQVSIKNSLIAFLFHAGLMLVFGLFAWLRERRRWSASVPS